jgi:hypothetical protein
MKHSKISFFILFLCAGSFGNLFPENQQTKQHDLDPVYVEKHVRQFEYTLDHLTRQRKTILRAHEEFKCSEVTFWAYIFNYSLKRRCEYIQRELNACDQEAKVLSHLIDDLRSKK